MNYSFLVYGDSHSKYFGLTREVKNLLKFDDLEIRLNSIRAASIKGFGNRDSTLNVSSEVLKAASGSEYDYLVLAFGQVDIELGYYYGRYVKKSLLSFDSFVVKVLNIYFDFIDSLPVEKEKIVVKGVNVPVLVYDRLRAINYTKRIIGEGSDGGASIVDEMRNNFPSSFTRNMNHIIFNELLEKRCKLKGVKYFDINNIICDRLSGLVKPDYVPGNFDHHLVDSLSVRCIHVKSLLEKVSV